MCSCEFWDILIEGLKVEHCSRNRIESFTKLSQINAGRKNSALTPKKLQSPQVQMRAVWKEQVNFGRKFISERAGVDKFRQADLSKTHLDVELDPQDGKSSCEKYG